jgi:hypothetical protein
MAQKPQLTLRPAPRRWNMTQQKGPDDSIFKTFKKDKTKRKKNKAAGKARKLNRK